MTDERDTLENYNSLPINHVTQHLTTRTITSSKWLTHVEDNALYFVEILAQMVLFLRQTHQAKECI